MPVKIRCSGCEKILKLPDAARGKVVKCPACNTKIRVPGGQGGPPRQKAPASAAERNAPAGKAKREKRAPKEIDAEHDDFLFSLNLKDIEDKSVRVCPKCGHEAKEEDTVCSKCGIDLQTGQLSEAARKAEEKARRKGPDPEEFWGIVWTDSWAFLRGNKKLVLRSILYWLIYSSMALGCGYMVLWCHRTPPKTFWAFCGFVSLMVGPGWTWFLHTVIINATLDRKDELKKVNFDFFLCAALGIKVFLWQIAVIQIVTGSLGLLLLSKGYPIVGSLSIGLGVLVCLALAPIAMAHMSMPVTYRAWILPVLVQTFFKTAAPALYWAVVYIGTTIPAIAGVAVIAAVYGNDVAEVANALNFNAKVAAAQGVEKPKAPKGAPAGQEAPADNDPLAAFRDAEKKPVNATALIAPAVIWLFVCACFGVSSVFNMRSNGQFVWYFKRHLDLIGEAKQIVYKPRATEEDEGKKKEMTPAQAVAMAFLVPVVAAAVGAAYGFSQGHMMAGIGTVLLFTGYGVAFIGGLMLLGAAFQESTLWGIAYLFVPFAALAFVIMHWTEAKKGFFVNLAGIVYMIIGFAISLAAAAAAIAEAGAGG